MPESQAHGFTWENEIKRNVFHIDSTISYTDVHDIPAELNPFNANETISIKTTGGGTVCMGDARRIFQYNPDQTHTAIVLRYRQVNGDKVLSNVYELDLSNKTLLWGDVTLADIEELTALVCSMPHHTRVPSISKDVTKLKLHLNKKSGLIKFNAKIDSKTQRRLQCSISKFASSAILKSSTTQPIVRGIAITSLLESARRVFKRVI